jgi:HPt (histidine-containing phosphotransfer) domain-containing protein
VNRVAESSAAGDTAALRRLGHDLVGMAGHLGLSRLSAAAVELGRQLRDGAAGIDAGGEAAAVLCREGGLAAEALRGYLGR